MKIDKVRCPLKDECGATMCDYEYRERECSYYYSNARPGAELEDQEMPANYEFEDFEEDEKAELVWIGIDKLVPHPDNPRKELGDLTELAESIKAKGILQNLTVVPFKSKTNPKFNGAGIYTIIIGHRRHAAAELAGLTEVPCVITEMTEREQIQTMMLENMQRSDLTIYEQAQGFQLMLDLGETKESIAATTGFSRSTVDRRIKLLNIDGKKFKDAETRGATLEDYLQVAEIEDQKTRDKLTDMLGTSNFSWQLREAKEAQLEKQKLPVVKAEMKRLGVAKNDAARSWDGDFDRVFCASFEKVEAGCFDNIIKSGNEYCWNVISRQVNIYKKVEKKKAAAPKKSEAELHAIELREKLADVTKKAYESRKDFCKSYNKKARHMDILEEWSEELLKWKFTGMYSPLDNKLLGEILGIEDCGAYNIPEAELERGLQEHPGNGKLAMLLAAGGGGKSAGYYDGNYGENKPEWSSNDKLDMVYDYLCKLGYEMSDEEKALQDGTHELFE